MPGRFGHGAFGLPHLRLRGAPVLFAGAGLCLFVQRLRCARLLLGIDRLRTGLVALASGLGSKKLLEGAVPPWMVLGTGTVLLLFSAFCFGAGVWRQFVIGTAPPEPDVHQLPPALLAAINGFLAMVVLTALIGLWVSPTGG